jgi:predicted DNA-binding protein
MIATKVCFKFFSYNYVNLNKGTKMTVTYSLDRELKDCVRDLAKQMGKKQSQIIKEAIEGYIDTLLDLQDAQECDYIANLKRRGEREGYTLAQSKQMRLNARAEANN